MALFLRDIVLKRQALKHPRRYKRTSIKTEVLIWFPRRPAPTYHPPGILHIPPGRRTPLRKEEHKDKLSVQRGLKSTLVKKWHYISGGVVPIQLNRNLDNIWWRGEIEMESIPPLKDVIQISPDTSSLAL